MLLQNYFNFVNNHLFNNPMGFLKQILFLSFFMFFLLNLNPEYAHIFTRCIAHNFNNLVYSHLLLMVFLLAGFVCYLQCLQLLLLLPQQLVLVSKLICCISLSLLLMVDHSRQILSLLFVLQLFLVERLLEMLDQPIFLLLGLLAYVLDELLKPI